MFRLLALFMASALLALQLSACSERASEQTLPTSDAGAESEAGQPQSATMHAGVVDENTADKSGEKTADEPVASNAAPQPLDLSVPKDILEETSPLPSAEQQAQLPDLFEVERPQRRTTISGGLLLNEEQTEQRHIDRIEGAQFDVKVRID